MLHSMTLAEALSDATAATVENMCFSALMGPAVPEPFTGAVSAQVTFEGDANGAVLVQLTPDAAASIAAGFLGADVDGPTDPSVPPVMLEVANMICGRMLSLHEPSGRFTLHPPRLTSAQLPSPVAECAFELEVGFIRVSTVISHAGNVQ